MAVWRNWQTQWTQNPPGATPSRFDSGDGHSKQLEAQGVWGYGSAAVINLLLSLAAGLLAFLLFYLTGIAHAWGSVLPGVAAFLGAFILLGRRTGKQLEAVMATVQKEMQARKPEKAVEILQQSFPLARWQFGIASSLNANIGALLYVQKKFDEAEVYLRKGASAPFLKLWLAQAMLGANAYRKKNYAEMERILDGAMKSSKNESLLYAMYAWCEAQRGEKKKAIEILQKGVTENPSDEKLKTLLQRAQNDKRLKMDVFGEQWWQFWLETPPMMQGPGGGAVFSGRQRFGRGFRR